MIRFSIFLSSVLILNWVRYNPFNQLNPLLEGILISFILKNKTSLKFYWDFDVYRVD